MKTTLTLEELPDNQEIAMTKKELMEHAQELATNAVYEFIQQCAEMAEANLCETECKDINRLFNAVLNGELYAPEPEEE